MSVAWPDLATLELLVVTGRTGSLSAAARELGLAQPNASRSVARLERRLGLQLLRRSPQGSELTTSGMLLAEWAQPVLTAAEVWRHGTESLVAGHQASLEIAASQTVAEYLAPRWLASYRNDHPMVDVRMRVANSRDTISMVSEHRVALGFIESPEQPTGLNSVRVHTDQLRVVVAPGHRWQRRRRPVELDELAGTALVVRETGSGTRDTLDRALAGRPVAPPALVLSSNAAVLGAVVAGAAPAVLSELAVAGAVASGAVVTVPLAHDEALVRELHAIWAGPQRLVGPAGELLRVAVGG